MKPAAKLEAFYLGDGLYASRDRWGIVELSTTRGTERHYVVLDHRTLAALKQWLLATEDA